MLGAIKTVEEKDVGPGVNAAAAQSYCCNGGYPDRPQILMQDR